MTVNPPSRLPIARDDDLLLDRPAPQHRRLLQASGEVDDLHAIRDAAGDERPVVYVQAPPARPTVLDWVSRGIGLLAKLTILLILLILLAVLWGIVSFVDMGARMPAAVGAGVGSALERGASAATSAAQSVADAFDPAHPPRQAFVHDAEIDELLRLNVGAEVPGSATRTVTVASIQRQANPSSPDTAIYAVLHGELRQPNETKILGVTLHSSRDPQDYFLYKGETVRIGQKLYKVNWVSMERQQLALIQYRDQDRVAAQLKAQID
jgi:hypothetical protein